MESRLHATPQRRVPLPLSNVPDADTDPVASEIDSLCRSEQKNYTTVGSITPRKTCDDDNEASSHSVIDYDLWKHKAFQPRRPPNVKRASESHTPQVTRSDDGTPMSTPPPPRPPPPGTFHGRKLYIPLQHLFDAISSPGETPQSRPGLLLLSLVCRELNPLMRGWQPSTSLEDAIESKQRLLDQADEERRARAKALRDQQQESPRLLTDREALHRQLEASRIEAALGKVHEANTLAALERQAQQEEERRNQEAAKRKQQGEERLLAAREAAARRKAERAKRLQSIIDRDEETMLEMEAVSRVRAQLEAEKAKEEQQHGVAVVER